MSLSANQRSMSLPPRLVVKVQTVETHYLESAAIGTSLGAWIDRTLADSQGDGRFPNRIVVDLNPPQAELDNDCR